MTLSQKLRYLRNQNGLTQDQVSSFLNISRTCYSNYELQKRTPPCSMIVLLADYYHVSIDYLLRDDYEEHPIIYTKETDRMIRKLLKKKDVN